MARITLEATSYVTNNDGTVTVNFSNYFGETVSGARLHSLLIDNATHSIEAISVTNTSANFDLSSLDNKNIAFGFEVDIKAPEMTGLVIPEVISTDKVDESIQIKVPITAPGFNNQDLFDILITGEIKGVSYKALQSYNSVTKDSNYIYFNVSATPRILSGAYDMVFHLQDLSPGKLKTLATSPTYRVYISNNNFDENIGELKKWFIPENQITVLQQGHSYVLNIRAFKDFEHCTFWIHYKHINGNTYRSKLGSIKNGKLHIEQKLLDNFNPEDVALNSSGNKKPLYTKATLRDPNDSSIEVGNWHGGDFSDTFWGIVSSEINTVNNNENLYEEEDI